jgi:hypothetical protein
VPSGAVLSLPPRPVLGVARHGVLAVLQLYLCSDDDGPRVQTMCMEESRIRRLTCALMERDVSTTDKRYAFGSQQGTDAAGPGVGGRLGAGGDVPSVVNAGKPDTTSVGLLRVFFDLLEVHTCCFRHPLIQLVL